MQTIKHKVEELLKKVEISNQSVAWWEDKVITLMDQLDSLGKNPKGKNLIKQKQIISELSSLIPRGQMEVETIDKLEKEIQTFLSNEKKKKKKGGSKNQI